MSLGEPNVKECEKSLRMSPKNQTLKNIISPKNQTLKNQTLKSEENH